MNHEQLREEVKAALRKWMGMASTMGGEAVYSYHANTSESSAMEDAIVNLITRERRAAVAAFGEELKEKLAPLRYKGIVYANIDDLLAKWREK